MSYREAADRCAGYIRLKGHTESTLASKHDKHAIRLCLAQLLHEELLRTPTPPGSAAGNSRRRLGDGDGRGRFVFWCISTEIERREPATSR